MVRHLWRAAGCSTLLVVCFVLLSSQSFGQGVGTGAGLGGAGLLNDPFTFYYAIYLPNQQLQSLRSTPMDTINYGAMVTRQYYAQNDRRGLYRPDFPLFRPELRSAPSLFTTTGVGACRQAVSIR